MAAILDETIEQAEVARQSLSRQAPSPQPTLRRFTVADYHKMSEAGVLTKNDRVELLEGVIIEMSPKGKRHAAATNRVTKVFIQTFGDRAIVTNQNPILLDDASEPEPDIALLAPQEKEYTDRLPQAADVLVILEVSDTTLKFDRETKGVTYAKAGIKQYLVMNVNARELIDMREPSPEGYRSYTTLRADDHINFVAFPEIEIKVSDLLPPE